MLVHEWVPSTYTHERQHTRGAKNCDQQSDTDAQRDSPCSHSNQLKTSLCRQKGAIRQPNRLVRPGQTCDCSSAQHMQDNCRTTPESGKASMHACRMTSSTNAGLKLCSFVPSGHKTTHHCAAQTIATSPYQLSPSLHINRQCPATGLLAASQPPKCSSPVGLQVAPCRLTHTHEIGPLRPA